MKHLYYAGSMLLVLLMAMASTIAVAQKPRAIFHKGDVLYSTTGDDASLTALGAGMKVRRSAVVETSEVAHFPTQMRTQPVTAEGYVFFQALKSPYADEWLYMEREQMGTNYSLYLFDAATGEKVKVFDEGAAPDKGYAFRPIAWSSTPDEVYIEAVILNSPWNHEGVWRYNLVTGEAEKVISGENTVSTPVISPDRKAFLYLGTTENKKNEIHYTADEVLRYSVEEKAVEVLSREAGVPHFVTGWVADKTDRDELLRLEEEDPDKKDMAGRKGSLENALTQTIDFYLPWDNGTSYCVSRHGSPAPTGSQTSQGYCGSPYTGFTPHSYVAIDFDTPNGVYDAIRAAAEGTVITKAYTGGYGNLVVLEHADGTQTYYAHLTSYANISVGQCVGKGEVVGDGGTTGNSTGDHLHFEWRSPGGSSLHYPSFVEAQGTPRQAYRYTSGNVPVVCGGGCANDAQNPVTSITGPSSATSNFSVSFSDSDNRDITDRFYQVLEWRNNEWRGNRGNGFYNDNFGDQSLFSDYTIGAANDPGSDWRGNWSETSGGRLYQSDGVSTNTGLTTFLSQTALAPYLYHFASRMVSTSGPQKFGMHIMSSSNTHRERGKGYLVWFNLSTQEVLIYKTNDVAPELTFVKKEAISVSTGFWADYKIMYDPISGRLDVFVNNNQVLNWTDSSPIQTGSYISLRTGEAAVEFDDLKVYKSRSSSATVTVSNFGCGQYGGDARFPSPDGTSPSCKVKSLSKDCGDNWSNLGNLDVVVTPSSTCRLSLNSEDEGIDMQIMPNPADNGSRVNVMFHQQEAGLITLTLFDMTGRKKVQLLSDYLSAGEHSLDVSEPVSGLQPGVYLIRMEAAGSPDKVIRLIKE
ncbi:peptidoglycan DD-metalloendopeptidase family protein [Roseivirga sp. BDSF3-8]|uniref:peptidoglycan DD-metalloendopeptidase family protein n=1 Tax=Roseivirga sp. BDSF3-8 TaxID=3241598 RepID=UPI0035319C3F